MVPLTEATTLENTVAIRATKFSIFFSLFFMEARELYGSLVVVTIFLGVSVLYIVLA